MLSEELDTAENVKTMFDEGIISEDCLTMDIYRPAVSEGAGILFWIHGGGFINGDATIYDGIEQAKRGNIVVIIQYRLGVFGFMNLFDTETGTARGGNYGFMDQQLALKYVFDNAAAIGGDPNKITLNGESAGAMSVALHLLHDESGKTLSTVKNGKNLTEMSFSKVYQRCYCPIRKLN